jgi:FkbM family methyltransferase
MVSSFLKSLVPLSIRRFVSFKITEYFKGGYFGHNGIDKKLEKYLPNRSGFYVELGANDGVKQSNSLFFELKKGWQGILIEPIPQNYMACAKVRGSKNRVHCNACVSFDYKEKFVEIQYANLMSISRSLELDLTNVDQHIEDSGITKKNAGTFTFGAVAKTLNLILQESNAPRFIDFLSLDVEGAELEVLKGINFNEFQFKYMVVECRQIGRLQKFLLQHGYVLVEKITVHDYLFEHSDLNL